MAYYINLETKEVTTDTEIISSHPIGWFGFPFNPEGYSVIFDSPHPVHDRYTQAIRLIAPKLTSKKHWEQVWEVYQLEGDALILAQKQKIEDAKNKIKSDISVLEATITPRRIREAILSINTTWLADVELKISQLRQQLAEL